MIELKNIEKVYKSKKSKNTKALDGISLAFDEKGITFILGKSGSGKSTLLNVIGGLDKYDSGDMIILGKSSKDFTQADFDSYRNTYIGFIFQEFNILEDYDVYQNIALALQLQQKCVNDDEINKLLERLELTELKSRKVNELSGGQKQRVAIARALIKNPKIILADEPTGNLDSKTGKQVMELLQEIAKEKLVIIVSHDEEYAEKYGNRIIEIKDGKVVRDTKEVKQALNNKNTYQTIKSKLPFKDSFKLGIGSLKHKKIKLVFTIILTIITLGFLSCTDTLSSYNSNVEHAKLLVDNNEQFVQVEKYHIFNDDGYTSKQQISLNESDEENITSKVNTTGYNVYKYCENSYCDEAPNRVLRIEEKSGGMYSSENYLEIVATNDISKILKESITGRNPKESNEIVISNALADMMIQNGVEVYEKVVENEFKVSNIFEPKTYEDILNTKYTYHFGEKGKVKIVGIINYDPSIFYKSNIINKIYVSEKFVSNLNNKKLESIKSYLSTDVEIEGVTPYNEYIYTNSAILDHELEYFDGTTWKKTNSLKENEVILNATQVIDDMKYQEELNNYLNRTSYNYYDYDNMKKRFFENYVKDVNVVGKNVTLKLSFDHYGDKSLYKEYKDLKVVGIYKDENNMDYYGNNNYFSKELLQDVRQQTLEKEAILYPMTDKKDFNNIIEKFGIDENFSIKSTYSNEVAGEKGIFDGLKKLAFYASIIFLVFSIFLITNFMITSIIYRKKEIGVLRALGARSKDVSSIFIWEGVVMAFISGTIASILLVVVTNLMNTFIKSQMSIITTPFLVGIRQFIVIYVLVFAVTMIASILPIIKISKMKPIDAILNK